MSWRDYVVENIDQFEAATASTEERHVLALTWFVGEVENGALFGYLYNDFGCDFHKVVAAAKAVGCSTLANLLHVVEYKFPNERVPVEQDARQEALDQMQNLYGEDLFDDVTRVICDEVFPELEAGIERYLVEKKLTSRLSTR